MRKVYEIPLSGKSQRFGISLGGVQYSLTVWWNAITEGWFLDIASASNSPILSGIPLVTGADLLAQYAYLGIGGSLIVQTDGDVQAIPTYKNLGSASHLYFVTP